jgi:hypothetical protein
VDSAAPGAGPDSPAFDFSPLPGLRGSTLRGEKGSQGPAKGSREWWIQAEVTLRQSQRLAFLVLPLVFCPCYNARN